VRGQSEIDDRFLVQIAGTVGQIAEIMPTHGRDSIL
jgi:hypothetical protein